MLEWSLIAGAMWLGILTSISPCPLATNIAAVAFLARRTGQGRKVAWAGLAYTLGRAFAYTGIAAAIVGGVLSAPALADILRNKLSGLVGPILILAGMVVAGWIPLRLPGSSRFNQIGNWLADRGLVGEFSMGILFALSFCPASAALFFGGLLPMSIQSDSAILLPSLYGLGTALPVLIAVFLLARGIELASRLQALQRVGSHLQAATGLLMVGLGVWLTVTNLV